MVDGERRGGSTEVRDRRERHERARGAGDVNRVERVRVLPVLRRHLHHHAVLIQPGVQRRDLPLPERVIERLVDRGGADTQPCGRIAVDLDERIGPAVLLVGVDVRNRAASCAAARRAAAPRC